MKLNTQTIERACHLARQASPKMRLSVVEFGKYLVTSPRSGETYEVAFKKIGQDKHGWCTCKAGEYGMSCAHIGAVIGLHVVLAAEQKQKSNVVDIITRRQAA